MNDIDFVRRLSEERERQQTLGFKDEHNSAFAWVAYIVNYVSRFALPRSFDVDKYNFGTCMVKTAALCMAAYDWWQTRVRMFDNGTDAESIPVLVN